MSASRTNTPKTQEHVALEREISNLGARIRRIQKSGALSGAYYALIAERDEKIRQEFRLRSMARWPEKACLVCGAPLTPEQMAIATSRGSEPRYCSTRCRNTARMRRSRAKARHEVRA